MDAGTDAALTSLGDPTRARILSLMRASPDGRVLVGRLATELGLRQPTVSHHMKTLLADGIVSREPVGRQVWYSVAPDAADLFAENVFYFWDQGFTGIDAALVVEDEWETDQIHSFERSLIEIGEAFTKKVTRGEYVHLNLINDSVSRIRSGVGLSLCAAGRTSVGIAPDGSIYPCHRFAGTGDCLLGHIDAGIDPDRRAPFLSVPELPAKCEGCAAGHVCTRGCPAKNLELTGKLFEAPTTTCRLERIKAKVAETVLAKLGMK